MQKTNLSPSKRNQGRKALPKGRVKISDSALQRARVRVGLGGDQWSEMNWYVQFSTLDFDNMSDGELLDVQEEVIAIYHDCSHTSPFDLLTHGQLKTIQQEIAKSLEGLVSQGCTTLDINYTLILMRPDYLHEREPLHPKSPHLNLPKIVTIKLMRDQKNSLDTIPTLRYRFAELLPLFAPSLLQCPKCKKIFLQFRRHAKFCSRVCQSRSAMENIRKKEKRPKAQSNASFKKQQDSPKKKERKK